MKITLQVFHNQKWHDAAELKADTQSQNVSLDYLKPYKIDFLFEQLETACSVNYPVEIFQTYQKQGWLGFIEDILPAGSSRRYWIRRLGLEGVARWKQDIILLQQATIAPIGNLRVKEAVPEKFADDLQERRFSVSDVVEHNIDFLEYAQEMGAMSGGATGAAGEAPKLLVRRNGESVWIDTYQDNLANLDQHYLVKFPRGKGLLRDQQILEAEYAYIKELNRLGFSAIDASKTHLQKQGDQISLWLPRFDVSYDKGYVEHYGLESMYSILEKPAGSLLNHFDVIQSICEKLQELNGFNANEFTKEWVKRDFLNVMFANSDNHGRNHAFLKKHGKIELAPIYDFAPMKADLEQIVRSIKWGRPYESGGDFDWKGITQQLKEHIQPTELWQELQALAAELVGLKERLLDYGVNAEFLEIPVLGMNSIESRLSKWELL